MKDQNTSRSVKFSFTSKMQHLSLLFQLSSCRVAKSECHKLLRAFVMLSLSTIQILATLLIDHSLYWLLDKVRHYGRKIDPSPTTNLVRFEVKGNGMLADMCQGIANSFDSLTKVYAIDTVPCLPHPIEPNYVMYEKILTIMGMIWIFLLLEPYGLRIRQKILECYYPARTEERAIWLYNEIMGERRLFVQMARRKARQRYLKDKAGSEGYYLMPVKIWKRVTKCLTLIKYRCSLCRESFTKYLNRIFITNKNLMIKNCF